jgi:DNA-binding MarR family transcriptional regulator
LDGSVGEGFDEYLFYLLTQVQNRRARGFAPGLEALGLTIPHWRALSTINRLGGCLMSELSDFTTTDRTTLTRTIDQLVESGLIERRTSREDRRLVRVELTEAGRACHGRAVEALVTYNAQALDGLSAEDQRCLRGVLQRMLRNIVSDDELFEQLLHYRR